ncbi:P-loop containing nucleoside triphosphate hydrolase protein [Mycena sanguinolenta]|nr:P-loop containing nucleoside triphosphate hydrolase protein [Mycena sanguinolenta]
MHQFFAQDIQKQKIYVLYGLGGAGKTQIALKFIQESTHFTDKFPVDASSMETIEIGLKTISVAKRAGNSPQDALKWLARKHENWLLLFDNADDPALDLSRFFAKCSHGNIIITTRNPVLRVYGAHSQVSDMEESDAVALLLQRACQQPSPTNQGLASEIVKELAYLPLAIIQAGAFISESSSLDTFLNLYRENRTELLKTKPAQGHDDYTWTVYTTWQMSFDRLSKPAATFLLLNQLQSVLDQKIAASDFLSHFLGPAAKWDSFRFMRLTNKIRAYSLINFNAEGKSFSIHPLVHNWSRTIIEHPESYAQCMNDILGMSSIEVAAKNKELQSVQLVSHVQFFMQTAPDAGDEFYPEYANVYYWAGQYTNAMELEVMILNKKRKLLGDDHLDTLQAMQNVAVIYKDLGQYDKAEQLEVEVLENRRKLLGDDHWKALNAMHNLAVTYANLGKYDKAERLEVVVLEKRKRLLGNDHLETLDAMQNLAVTYKSVCQYDKAEQLEVVVLEKRKKLLGDDHLATLKVMQNLAVTYGNLGQNDKAEQLAVVVLEKRRKLFGNDHLSTLMAMHILAILYDRLGRTEEAEKLQVVVLEKRRKLLGDDHLDTLYAMNNLGSTYWRQGQFAKAEDILVVAVDKTRRLFGDDHPVTRTVIDSLLQTQRGLDKLTEAAYLEKLITDKLHGV